MNFWLRLLLQLFHSARSSPLALPDGVSVRSARVWPVDLDVFGHMNNGRYLTHMDLGRADLLLRTGLLHVVRQDRLTPIIGSALIRFRRELGPFQRFDIETRIAGWRDTTAVIQQDFRIRSGPRDGEVAAVALVRAGLYDRQARAFVPVDRLLEKLVVTAQSPPMSKEAEAFLAADGALKRPER
jgi:acyl-CoA thioesterase FadM